MSTNISGINISALNISYFPYTAGNIIYSHFDDNGFYHNSKGPAAIFDNGNYSWYKHGTLHRIGGPAVKYGGKLMWFMDGKYHRLDGPAIFEDEHISLWYFHGKHIECSSQEEFERLIKLKMFW
jgi:hypothetical protein